MNRTQNDRFGIYSTHETEIRDIAKKLKYSVDDVLSAIQEVGFNEDEIEEYIRDRQDRSFWVRRAGSGERTEGSVGVSEECRFKGLYVVKSLVWRRSED